MFFYIFGEYVHFVFVCIDLVSGDVFEYDEPVDNICRQYITVISRAHGNKCGKLIFFKTTVYFIHHEIIA